MDGEGKVVNTETCGSDTIIGGPAATAAGNMTDHEMSKTFTFSNP